MSATASAPPGDSPLNPTGDFRPRDSLGYSPQMKTPGAVPGIICLSITSYSLRPDVTFK